MSRITAHTLQSLDSTLRHVSQFLSRSLTAWATAGRF
jgi:hypothetical protein